MGIIYNRRKVIILEHEEDDMDYAKSMSPREAIDWFQVKFPGSNVKDYEKFIKYIKSGTATLL
jgi:hypothetical protein